MEDSRSFSYTVIQKAEGKWKLARIALLLLYAAVAGVYIAIFATRIPWLISVLPLLIWILVFFTWRYVSVSYSYSIESGQWKLWRVLSERFPQKPTTFHIKDLIAIAPLTDVTSKDSLCQRFGAQSLLWAASSASCPDLYYALGKKENEKTVLIVFEATAKALQLLRYYNSATVVTQVRY